MNPEKLQTVQPKLVAFLAQEKEQKERAQRCFVSYLRSVYLMKNKEVFDVLKLQIQEFAVSLGLAVAPRVRFLNKVLAKTAEGGEQKEEEQSEDDELRSFKAQLRENIPHGEGQNYQSEDSDEDGESGDEQNATQMKTRLLGDDDDDDDLRDLDLLKVKTKNVFSLTKEQENEGELSKGSKKDLGKETKFKDAKKVLKRNFHVNTKVTFNEEGDAVQQWPPVQRAVTDDEDEEVSGINVEKAKERLKHEDQVFDKQEYSSKVKAKHREKRLKAKAARREASRQHGQQSEEEEEEEVVAYLANHDEDEFDPSTLPDPDNLRSLEEEKEDQKDQRRSAKRQQSSESSDEEHIAGKRKKVRQLNDEHIPLDTGLSLAEDEELVLHLLGGMR